MDNNENLKRIGKIIDILTERLDDDIVEILMNELYCDREEVEKYLKAIKNLDYLQSSDLKSSIDDYEEYNNSLE